MKCDLEAFDVQLSLHFLIYLGLGLFYTSNDFTDLFLRLAFQFTLAMSMQRRIVLQSTSDGFEELLIKFSMI